MPSRVGVPSFGSHLVDQEIVECEGGDFCWVELPTVLRRCWLDGRKVELELISVLILRANSQKSS